MVDLSFLERKHRLTMRHCHGVYGISNAHILKIAANWQLSS
jgi:hypothetical protein